MSPHLPSPSSIASPLETPSLLRGAGLTLLELMLALGLSSIVIAAGLSIAVATQQASNTQSNRSYVQELGRGLLSAIANDLSRAGLGGYDITDQVEMGKIPTGSQPAMEWAAVFKQFTVNNDNDGDVLQFLSGQSPDGLSGVAAFTMDDAPIQIAPEVAVTVTLNAGGIEGFRVRYPGGTPLGVTERISLFTRDRAFVGTGDYTPDDSNPNATNGAFTFTYHAPDPGLLSWDPITALEPATIVVRGPWIITWRLGQMIDDQGNTATCLQQFHCVRPFPNGADGAAGNECMPGECIGPVEDFQIGFLMRDTSTVDIGGNWSGLQNVETRLNIRAVQVWILVRSPGPDLLTPDTRTYQLGNRTYTVDPRYARHQRQVFTKLIPMPNVKD